VLPLLLHMPAAADASIFSFLQGFFLVVAADLTAVAAQ
jgi:hypothetical protein